MIRAARRLVFANPSGSSSTELPRARSPNFAHACPSTQLQTIGCCSAVIRAARHIDGKLERRNMRATAETRRKARLWPKRQGDQTPGRPPGWIEENTAAHVCPIGGTVWRVRRRIERSRRAPDGPRILRRFFAALFLQNILDEFSPPLPACPVECLRMGCRARRILCVSRHPGECRRGCGDESGESRGGQCRVGGDGR